MLNQYKIYWHKHGTRDKGTTIIASETGERARYTFLHRFSGRVMDRVIKL